MFCYSIMDNIDKVLPGEPISMGKFIQRNQGWSIASSPLSAVANHPRPTLLSAEIHQKSQCRFMLHLSIEGVIYTADILDRETTKSYWLTVYATDHGVVPLYTTIEVYIEVEDVNDNAPLTSEPIYYPTVMENSPKDVSVIQIQAQDPDSSTNEKLTYRITSGNPQNFFVINPKTGMRLCYTESAEQC
ncbi:hypothetical protein Q9966_014163 [Columba livia]|nr:hypothetical protein Q9966_014163 [Columba livia]